MADADRFAVGRMAQRYAEGYYAFLVAHLVAVNPRAINSLPPVDQAGHVTGEVTRKDGSAHTLDLRHYLDKLREDFSLQGDLLRLWATGALLTLGQELAAHHYFDHHPLLEMVYHLRNGLAHGNRFDFQKHGLERLAKHPANNFAARVRSPLGTRYEITPALQGTPVLFDFLGAADIIDLLQSVELLLTT